MTLSEAFAKYGAKLSNPQWAVSAIADDGAVVMSCWRHYIKTIDGIWRYEDTLSRWSGNAAGNKLCRQHVEEAFKSSLPVRLVIVSTEDTDTVDSGQDASKVKKDFDPRPEKVGRITHYDGDRFVIEFRNKKA